MLAMPLKPVKKVRVKPEGRGRFTLTFVSKVRSAAEFHTIIREQIAPCLGDLDALVNPQWETRSVLIITQDWEAFRERLIYKAFLVQVEPTSEEDSGKQ